MRRLRLRRRLLVLSASALLLGLSSHDRADACDRALNSARAVAERLVAADNAHDLSTVLEQYSDDAMLIGPDGTVVEGKDRIRPHYEEIFDHFQFDIRMEIDEEGFGDEWAFLRGRTLGTITARSSGERKAVSDRFLMILQCDPDRGWRVSRLMWVHADEE